jgi:hypothetical protein
MDVRNLGTTDLHLRLVFSDPLVGPPANVAFSTDPILLPAAGDWTSIVFPLGISDLTAGLGSVETALKNATELRIYHSVDPNFPNPANPIPSIVALLGVDNIQARAASVPESVSTGMLLAFGSLGLLLARRRRGVKALES